jgi:hypothetical protein
VEEAITGEGGGIATTITKATTTRVGVATNTMATITTKAEATTTSTTKVAAGTKMGAAEAAEAAAEDTTVTIIIKVAVVRMVVMATVAEADLTRVRVEEQVACRAGAAEVVQPSHCRAEITYGRSIPWIRLAAAPNRPSSDGSPSKAVSAPVFASRFPCSFACYAKSLLSKVCNSVDLVSPSKVWSGVCGSCANLQERQGRGSRGQH